MWMLPLSDLHCMSFAHTTDLHTPLISAVISATHKHTYSRFPSGLVFPRNSGAQDLHLADTIE